MLKGEALKRRLVELQQTAASKHRAAADAGQAMLEAVRDAGNALREVKRRLGHRSKWSRWSQNFADKERVSRRTQCVYMQIAKHWKEDRVVEARTRVHDPVKTIRGLLAVIQSSKIDRDIEKYNEDTVRKIEEPNTANLKRSFARWLKSLTSEQRRTLVEEIEDIFRTTLDETLARCTEQRESHEARAAQSKVGDRTSPHSPRIRDRRARDHISDSAW